MAAEMAECVSAKGGIEAVVAAMNAHRDVLAVQEQGCQALANMARFEVNLNQARSHTPWKCFINILSLFLSFQLCIK
jgi:hypothetical protein